MPDFVDLHADKVSSRDLHKLWPEPSRFISAMMASTLCPLAIYSREIIEKYKFDDLMICEQPVAVLTEKELEGWSGASEPEDAPSLWQGTLWRHPTAVAAALDRMADRVEAEDPEFDCIVEIVYTARRDSEEEPVRPPLTDEQWAKFRVEHRALAVESLRKFADFCRKLAEHGATKIVALTYF